MTVFGISCVLLQRALRWYDSVNSKSVSPSRDIVPSCTQSNSPLSKRYYSVLCACTDVGIGKRGRARGLRLRALTDSINNLDVAGATAYIKNSSSTCSSLLHFKLLSSFIHVYRDIMYTSIHYKRRAILL
jgi:hypothetical protein